MVTALSEQERAAAVDVAARTDLPEVGRVIVSEVAEIFRVGEDCIYGESRLRRLVDARTVIACALRARGWTFDDIGILLNRHHTTILHLEERSWSDPELKSLAKAIAA